MRYTRDMEEFRTGYGRDWLDFAITLVDRYGATPRDLVETPARLRAWLTEWGMVPTDPVTDDDVAQARALREALHGLARAAATEQAPSARDVRVVNAALLDAPSAGAAPLRHHDDRGPSGHDAPGAGATCSPGGRRPDRAEPAAAARLRRRRVLRDLRGPHRTSSLVLRRALRRQGTGARAPRSEARVRLTSSVSRGSGVRRAPGRARTSRARPCEVIRWASFALRMLPSSTITVGMFERFSVPRSERKSRPSPPAM